MELPAQGASSLGVVYDVDSLLRIAPLGRQLSRLRVLLSRSPRDRRSLLGMSHLLRVLAGSAPDAPVFYLTALSKRLARPVAGLLHRDNYPSGELLPAEGTRVPGWLLGVGLSRKRAALSRLAERYPEVRWVLIGDDAGHDPKLFVDFARRHPDRVAAVALRQVLAPADAEAFWAGPNVAVVRAPNGEEMLPQLQAALGLERPRQASVEDWFLTTHERGNDATRLRTWTTVNAVRPLVHGSTYFSVLAEALEKTGAGDTVLVAGWRADSDQMLTDHGPTVAEALTGAARRGALVRGLLWRSHPEAIGYQVERNRTFAGDVNAAGGQVLLDQRIRALGCHHQKLVVIRHDGRPGDDSPDDLAFVGGIDLDNGSRDDAAHDGDPQPVASDDEYDRAPRHDMQVELRGPAVRDVEDAFRERWDDPAPLARLPWHVIPDRIHRLPRTAAPLPPPARDPPAAGSCAVQILRTYPRRRPPYPFAPLGERSIARAYTKALSRARRLVYLEDQYLWSIDVARTFAAALRRAPQLHLIAVVPTGTDDAPAALGQGEALAMVHEAGGDRVQIFDIENHEGRPIYVHAKVCIIDDAWATVGSNNFNNRSWTHDSELTAAILDDDRDPRAPADPAGLGDGARRFARQLRLDLMREHLDLEDDTADTALLDPDRAAETARRHAAALDAWHADGRQGPRPPGWLRRHAPGHEQARRTARRHRWLIDPAYRMVLDPDGRPLGMRMRRTF